MLIRFCLISNKIVYFYNERKLGFFQRQNNKVMRGTKQIKKETQKILGKSTEIGYL